MSEKMLRYNYEDDNDDKMKSDNNSPHVSFGPTELNKENILLSIPPNIKIQRVHLFLLSFLHLHV